jgi:hypothetical protein
MDDDSFEFLFKPIMNKVMSQYRPNVIVLQSGELPGKARDSGKSAERPCQPPGGGWAGRCRWAWPECALSSLRGGASLQETSCPALLHCGGVLHCCAQVRTA